MRKQRACIGVFALLGCLVVATAASAQQMGARRAAVQPVVELPGQVAESLPGEDLLDLSLEQLSQQSARVRVPGPPPATLTAIGPELDQEGVGGAAASEPTAAGVDRLTPAAVTRIDQEMIWSSGARSLSELLEIYVPNVQVIGHLFSFEHITPRGLVSDLEDKYLLLVNGRVMNQRTITGAFSEVRDLPMLADIHHVDFIRGPGSAIYGPGAVSGVISIVTHNGLTFEGTDATVRQGAFETFTQLEVRHGVKLDDDSGFFFYYGAADYLGADEDDAPIVLGQSSSGPGGTPTIVAGEPVDVPDIFDNYHRSYRGKPKHKLHAQYTNGGFDFWVRYTRGGEKATPPAGFLRTDPDLLDDANVLDSFSFGYQQTTVFSSYTHEINDCWSTEFRLGYDTFDWERLGFASEPSTPAREDEYSGRVLARWTPNDSHSVAAGFELTHEIFGLKSPGFPNVPPSVPLQGSTGLPWDTTTYSFLGEYQWKISDEWTTFLTGRWDDHTFTDTLFSPRAAVVFTPNDVDTFKFIATESARRAPDDQLRFQFLQTGTFADAESIKSLELRYEYQPCDHWFMGLSGFHQDSAFVGFTALGPSSQAQFADVKTWGLELEGAYRTKTNRVVASHCYTKLDEFELVGPFALPPGFDVTVPNYFVQGFSAAPYGFGDDLANYSPHLSKLAIHHDHDCCWTSDMSMVVYWEFPGDEDVAEFNRARGAPTTDPGYDKAFRGSYYLNYGLEYRPYRCMVTRLDLYNILGWIDQDLNKRNIIFDSADYRSEPAAIALTARVDF